MGPDFPSLPGDPDMSFLEAFDRQQALIDAVAAENASMSFDLPFDLGDPPMLMAA